MTNEEIVSSLHKMVDRYAEMLEDPLLKGTLPLVRITLKADENGNRMRLTVGCDYAEDDKKEEWTWEITR